MKKYLLLLNVLLLFSCSPKMILSSDHKNFSYSDENNNIEDLNTQKKINHSPDNEKINTKNISFLNFNKTFNLCATFNYGIAFRVGDTPKGLNNETENYLKKLNIGSSYDFGLYYVNSKKTGFGLKYNLFKASGNMNNLYLETQIGTKGIGSISDDISIMFIGPCFTMDGKNLSSRHEGNLEVAFGYIGYKNESIALNEKYSISGYNFGMTAGLGYRYRFYKNFSIGPQVNFIGGVLKDYEISGPNGFKKNVTLSKENVESLWRIDLTLGIIYRF